MLPAIRRGIAVAGYAVAIAAVAGAKAYRQLGETSNFAFFRIFELHFGVYFCQTRRHFEISSLLGATNWHVLMAGEQAKPFGRLLGLRLAGCGYS